MIRPKRAGDSKVGRAVRGVATVLGAIVAIPVAIAALIIMVALFMTFVGVILSPYLSAEADRPIQALGGCPSPQVPTIAGESLNESSVIQTGWPPTTAGCWTTSSVNQSATEAFAYFSVPSHTPGWTLSRAFPESTTMEFVGSRNPSLRLLLSVSGPEAALFWRPGQTRVDATICACDPHLLEG